MRTILPSTENPILRKKAETIPLAQIKSKRTQTLIKDMQKLLAKEAFGVALAAPQVGEPLQLFIISGRALSLGERERVKTKSAAVKSKVDASKQTPGPDQIYINPQITKMSRAKKEKHEGCLSIRGKWGMVPRAEKVTVRAYDENGTRVTRGASGFLAHIFQHETDHLKGVLYTDKAIALYDESEEE